MFRKKNTKEKNELLKRNENYPNGRLPSYRRGRIATLQLTNKIVHHSMQEDDKHYKDCTVIKKTL